MASGDYYVDAAAGADTNGGTSEGAAIVSGASADTDGTTTVDLSDDTPDLSGVSVGDCIYLASENGNGIRSGDIFEITEVNDGADTVTVTPTPGTNANQAWAIGGAWATISKAMLTVRNDGDHVYIKGGTNYTETATVSLIVEDATPCIIEGYTTTPGDNGLCIIDGGGVRANGLADSVSGYGFYIFKNIRVTDCTGDGGNMAMLGTNYHNCHFDNNAGNGLILNDMNNVIGCSFDDNDDNGFIADYNQAVIGCRANRNGLVGLKITSGCVINCVAVSNASMGIQVINNKSVMISLVMNCTVDGDGKDTDVGITLGGPNDSRQALCINNIAYDCGVGIDFPNQGGTAHSIVSMNNLVNSNTAAYANDGITHSGEVTDAPAFEAEGTDYRLADASPAIDAGFDASQVCGFDPGCDIGAHQREDDEGGEAGGGGLLSPNKRAGKQ